jgi:hypothetical protein
MESDVLIQMPTRRLVVSSHFQLNCSTTFYQSQNLTVELFWMVPQLQGIDVSFSIKLIHFFLALIITQIQLKRLIRAGEFGRRKSF